MKQTEETAWSWSQRCQIFEMGNSSLESQIFTSQTQFWLYWLRTRICRQWLYRIFSRFKRFMNVFKNFLFQKTLQMLSLMMVKLRDKFLQKIAFKCFGWCWNCIINFTSCYNFFILQEEHHSAAGASEIDEGNFITDDDEDRNENGILCRQIFQLFNK